MAKRPSKPDLKSSGSVRAPADTQDQQVYAHIFDAILEQRLAPGTKLTEEALGEVFGVSRTIIRRSLDRLAHEGVVNFIPNRGAFVAKPDVDQAREILEARRLIELAVVERVANRAGQLEVQIKKLRKLIREEHESSAREDYGTAIRLSGEFHLYLSQLAGNEPLGGFLRSLVPQTSLIISLYESSNGSRCAIDEHSQLIDAIEAGDVGLSVRLMSEHLDHIESRLDFYQEGSVENLRHLFEGKQVKR